MIAILGFLLRIFVLSKLRLCNDRLQPTQPKGEDNQLVDANPLHQRSCLGKCYTT